MPDDVMMGKVLEFLKAKGKEGPAAGAIAKAAMKMRKPEEPEEKVLEYAGQLCEGAANYALDTVDLPNQEVFAAGTWNGDSYTEADLDEMVRAFNETNAIYKPSLKLTHDHPRGWPAVGVVENLRRVGTKLLGDFLRIPRGIYEIIESGGYRGKSAEIYWNHSIDGKHYPYLMKAVALLGPEMKAVEKISDLLSLYSIGGEARAYEEGDGEFKSYDPSKSKEEDMTIEELQKKNGELEAMYSQSQTEVKRLADENKGLSGELENAKKVADDAQAKVSEYQKKATDAEIGAVVDKLIADKKLAPAKKESMFSLLNAVRAAGGEKKYKLNEKEASLEEVALDLVGSGSVELPTETQTQYSREESSDLDRLAKDYQAKHPDTSYKDALRAVAPKAKQ